MRHRAAAVLLAAGLSFTSSALSAQEIQLDGFGRPAAHASHVVLLSDALEISAGKPQSAELRFRVAPGFHINSHRPTDELLIPTTLHLQLPSGASVSGIEFPAGSPFRLKLGEGDLLDVYQGEFRVRFQLAGVPKGQTTLEGKLRYQACDSAACFPPRNLPLRVLITAK